MRNEVSVTILKSVISLRNKKTSLRKLILSTFKRERKERAREERESKLKITLTMRFK